MTFTAIRFSKPRRRLLLSAITLPVVSIVLALAFPARAQEAPHRIILKDGSYQIVNKYEVKGDRVRYLSAERGEWEELPSSLVDWPATEKFEKERAAAPAIPEAAAIDKETDAEREAELSDLPQVAPGLRLLEDSGVFLLDNFKGQPQLVEMQQTEGDVNPNTTANIFRGALKPIASAKQTIELEGEHAAVHVHVAVPSFYINVEDATPVGPPSGQTASAQPSQPSLDAPRAQQPQKPEQPEKALVPFDRFRIVQAKVKGGKRTIGDLKRSTSGKVSENGSFVKTTIDRVSGGWLKLTPTADLAPGEYALIETSGAGEGMNLYVWDFGVNPNAPANAHPYKPEAKPGDTQKSN